MVQDSRTSIQIDLNEFELHLHLKNRPPLTLHFDSPSRRFYLSVIALVVNEMKRLGKIKSIPLQEHLNLLILLNESIGGAAGSSEKENLLHRIYRKWKDALPNLEEAPLFKVLGKKKEVGDGAIGKIYSFGEAEKDGWANLFGYTGSEENVRLKFAVDRIGLTLDDVAVLYEDSLNAEAWEKFISSLKGKERVREEAEPDQPVSEESEVSAPPVERRKTLLSGRYRWVVLVGAIVVVLGAIIFAILRPHSKPDPNDVASIEKMASPLPDVPSIAVLPFVNLSEDPKQEFLSDGMTDEIITALSKVPRLFVIARTSTDTYKGKPVKVKQVSEELGVRYVLEGGLQRSGDRIRITAQLIDALTGNHLWAERYDRDLKDLFALQDEITIKILAGVGTKVMWGGQVRPGLLEKYYSGKQGLDCYLKLMEASGRFQRFNTADTNIARQLTEEVMEMCPENPFAYVTLGWVYSRDYQLGNTKFPRETLEKIRELAPKALAIDDSLGGAHSLLSWFYRFAGDLDRGIAEGERSVTLNPGNTAILDNYAAALHDAGRDEEAIRLFQKEIRRNPFATPNFHRDFADALGGAGRLEEAISAYKKAIQIAPDHFGAALNLASAYSIMGRDEEARAEVAEVLRINPKYSLDYEKQRLASMHAYPQWKIDRHINALRKAGLK